MTCFLMCGVIWLRRGRKKEQMHPKQKLLIQISAPPETHPYPPHLSFQLTQISAAHPEEHPGYHPHPPLLLTQRLVPRPGSPRPHQGLLTTQQSARPEGHRCCHNLTLIHKMSHPQLIQSFNRPKGHRHNLIVMKKISRPQ